MTIYTDGLLTPTDLGMHEAPLGTGEYLYESARQALAAGSTAEAANAAGVAGARMGYQAPLGNPMGDFGPPADDYGESERQRAAAAVAMVPIDEARKRVKSAGLEDQLGNLGDAPIREPALNLMMRNAFDRKRREATMARLPQGWGPWLASGAVGLLASAVDPINLATAFVPVVPEARGAAWLARAGESIARRGAVRAGIGATQGAAGMAMLQPLDWLEHSEEGQDFTIGEALRGVAFGALLGAGIHAGGGTAADLYRRATGRPLTPPGQLADLPPEAQTQALRAAAARLTQGGAVDVAEVLAEAARHDPRIAESIEPADAAGTIDQAYRAIAAKPAPEAAPEALQASASAAALPEHPAVTASTDPVSRAGQGHPAEPARYEPSTAPDAEALRTQEAVARATAAQAEELDRRAIHENIKQQLLAAGQPEDVSEQLAGIAAARYVARARRLGRPGQAEQIFGRSGIEVRRGGGAAEGRAFAQEPSAVRRKGIPAAAEPIVHSHRDVEAIKANPHYEDAKAGDAEAARQLVSETVKPETIEEAKRRFGPDAIYVPVHAEEAAGRNKIPMYLAHYYAAATGAQVDERIVQASRAYHTGARPMERIIARPSFDGPVVAGGRYVLVDDVTLMGNTLAELAHHIQEGGGEVAGVVTLANAGRMPHIVAKSARTRRLEANLGNSVESELGIAPGALTAAETEYLLGFRDADALRASVAKARRERGERLRAQGLRPSETGGTTSERDLDRSFDQRPLAPTFYSAVERAINSAKQDKASPDQWAGMLRNAPGVKPEEREWLGLDDWLKQQKGTVTKQQMADYVRANAIEVKEVMYGGRALPAFEQKMIEKYGNREDLWDVMQESERTEWDRIYRADQNSAEQYGNYQEPGGKNYHELLLTLPSRNTRLQEIDRRIREIYELTQNSHVMAAELRNLLDEKDYLDHPEGSDPKVDFRHQHWDEPNVLAHVRFNDRTVDGRKTLFLEEVQSDWHQAGRKKGYFEPASAEQLAQAESIGKREEFQRAVDEANRSRVPDAPFKTTWPELVMKRMIRWAAENGYDQIAWTTGETQAARYDLAKQIRTVRLQDLPGGKYALTAHDHMGHEVIHQQVTADELPDVIGKDVAERLLAAIPETKFDPDAYPRTKTTTRKLDGLELKVGGEGMKGFYDQILPAAVAKLTKKFGAKVGEAEMQTSPSADYAVRAVDVEDHEGAFQAAHYEVFDRETGEAVEQFGNRAAAEAYIAEQAPAPNTQKIHTLSITPQLRQAATEQGFPLFQRGREGAPQGRVTFADHKRIIELFETANASTALHEFGHVWLDELMTDAAHPEAPTELRHDRDVVLGWLGAKDGEPLTTEQHEQWARGFEQYLREGKAPSLSLATAFEHFARWLKEIYRRVTQLGVPINDEIRGVMDRMLASDEDTAEKRANDNTVHVRAPRRAIDETRLSVIPFLAARGGVQPSADLKALFDGKDFVPGHGRALRQRGMTEDQAREALVEAGYIHDDPNRVGGGTTTIRDLHEAIANELRGRKIYRAGHEPEAATFDRDEETARIEAHVDSAFEAEGIPKPEGPLYDRVVELVRGGIRDPLDALERASMEEHYADRAEGTERPLVAPGAAQRALLDDARGTSGDGGGAAAEGAAGHPLAGAGEGARPAGGGDRAAAGARDAGAGGNGQRQFGGGAGKPGQSDAVAPRSKATEAALQAEQAQAKTLEAQMSLAVDKDPAVTYGFNPDGSPRRMKLSEALDQVERDTGKKVQMLAKGAACLAARAGVR